MLQDKEKWWEKDKAGGHKKTNKRYQKRFLWNHEYTYLEKNGDPGHLLNHYILKGYVDALEEWVHDERVTPDIIAQGVYTLAQMWPKGGTHQQLYQDLFQVLMSKKSLLQIPMKEEEPWIFQALWSGNVEFAQLLWDYGADMSHKNINQETFLHRVILEECDGLFDWAWSKIDELDWDGKDLEGATPLYRSIDLKRWDWASQLAEKGANLDADIVEGQDVGLTPLSLACKKGKNGEDWSVYWMSRMLNRDLTEVTTEGKGKKRL